MQDKELAKLAYDLASSVLYRKDTLANREPYNYELDPMYAKAVKVMKHLIRSKETQQGYD